MYDCGSESRNLYLEKAIDAFRRKGSANANTNDVLPDSVCDLIECSRKELEPLFIRAFENTNI